MHIEAQQSGSSHRPGGLPLDRHSQFPTKALLSRDHSPNVIVGPTRKPPRKLGDGEGEQMFKSHAPNSMTSKVGVKPSGQIVSRDLVPHNPNMSEDVWPKRVNFRQRLKEWTKREHKTQADFVALLNKKVKCSLGHLQNALYKPDKILGNAILAEAVKIFGPPCTMMEFIDDPGSKPGGIPLRDLDPLPRAQFERMIQSTNTLLLTQEDLDILFDDYMRDAQRRDASNRKNKL